MRLRITFSKGGPLRYIGHLDLQQVWERTARRASLPLAYTQGFHPGPRLQLASALPLGFIGRSEVVDMWLEAGDPPERPYRELLQSAAPPGLGILTVEPVDERLPALQTQVAAAQYEVALLESVTGLEEKVMQVLATPSLPRERRGKPYDLRPLILSLECALSSLRMVLSAREAATGRPEEVLAVLGIPLAEARIERTRLILKEDDRNRPPG
jgi:radical SAM-linked protein